MITLYLARHGQTEENIARIFQGHMPGTLTVEGIAQAEALRDTLRNISLDAVVSSDLKRCVDTARIAVEGRNLPWEKTVLLREICLLYTSPSPRDAHESRMPSSA